MDNNNKLYGGGSGAILFSKTERILTDTEAADILEQNISVSYEPPYRPSGGSVYLYSDSGKSNLADDWKSDGYTWRQYGYRSFTVNGKRIEKRFFKISNKGVDDTRFIKHVFRFTNTDYNQKTVIMHYGQSDAYLGLSHGNRKRNDREYKRTKPSVLQEIREFGLTDKPKHLNDMIKTQKSPESNLLGVSVPRNDKQIHNMQSKLRKEAKLSHDSLYGLHLLVDQL